jgi:hypothetical protein
MVHIAIFKYWGPNYKWGETLGGKANFPQSFRIDVFIFLCLCLHFTPQSHGSESSSIWLIWGGQSHPMALGDSSTTPKGEIIIINFFF